MHHSVNGCKAKPSLQNRIRPKWWGVQDQECGFAHTFLAARHYYSHLFFYHPVINLSVRCWFIFMQLVRSSIDSICKRFSPLFPVCFSDTSCLEFGKLKLVVFAKMQQRKCKQSGLLWAGNLLPKRAF